MEVLLYVLTVLLVHGQQASGQGELVQIFTFTYIATVNDHRIAF